MNIPPAPPELPNDVLAKRAQLPTKFAPVTLTGQHVRLEPLVLERDLEPLFAVSNGQPITLGARSVGVYDSEEIIWRYLFAGPFANIDEFADQLRAGAEAPNGLCFCVFDVESGHQVGVYNYMNNYPAHLKVELGGIWYSPIMQRTKANLEATYLTLRHAFDLGYRRLEWKCNALNERSRHSALRMGFKFEGIQEAHMIVKGRNRDTAWFRILDGEWPEVKARLEGMLGEA